MSRFLINSILIKIHSIKIKNQDKAETERTVLSKKRFTW